MKNDKKPTTKKFVVVPAIKQIVMQNPIDKVQFVNYTYNIFALFYRQAVNYGLQKE